MVEISATSQRSAGELAQFACVMEVITPKVGNVYPGADFDDATWEDFIVSAAVIRPILEQAADRRVGETVLRCVQSTAAACGNNTNLGMILLLAPLCAAAPASDLRTGIADVLRALDARDAADVYAAIRLAQPGGLGEVDEADVHSATPPADLLDAMRLAEHRDAVARQYVTGFDRVFQLADRLAQLAADDAAMDDAIAQLHLEQLAHEPDSLIARKAGPAAAESVEQRARQVLEAGFPGRERARKLCAKLDIDLREEGNQLNPGTTADLVTAAIFVALRQGRISCTVRWGRALSSWRELT